MRSQKAAGWRETAISPSNNPACLWFSGSNFCIVTVNYRSQMISKVGCPGKRLCKSIFHSLPTPRLFRTFRAKKNGTPPQPSWGWGGWNETSLGIQMVFPAPFCYVSSVWPWPSHLTSLSAVLIYSTGMLWSTPLKGTMGNTRCQSPPCACPEQGLSSLITGLLRYMLYTMKCIHSKYTI